MSHIETLFNTTFAISVKTRASDGQGGHPVSWEEAGSVEGRMRPASATERLMAAQRQAELSHVLYVDADEMIQRGNRVSDGDRTWEVVAIREPSLAGHHLEIECREIQLEGMP
jgi:SPP1 family predicted phage head-tail adaptor